MDERTGLPVVGVVGGAELGRMTWQAAVTLGQSLRVLATREPEADFGLAEATPWRLGDLESLRGFAKGCDVLTVCAEEVQAEHLAALAAEGVLVLPEPGVVAVARDPSRWRARLAELGEPVAAAPHRAEGLSLLVSVARSPFGQVAAYPVAEITRAAGDARGAGGVAVTTAPAPGVDSELALLAQRIAIEVATGLRATGVLGVELVGESATGEVRVVDVTARPHRRGNWTLDGARTSQFEQHLRAVLDYPLGDVATLAPFVATMSVRDVVPGGMSLDERLHHCYAADPGVRAHLYGVPPGRGRAAGHVTVLGEDSEDVRARAARAARWLREGVDD